MRLQHLRRFAKRFVYETWPGYCPICECKVRFLVTGSWYRDQLLCDHCFSIPRERAVMRVIQLLYPSWRALRIHESSPIDSGASAKLRRDCPAYVSSQYHPDQPFGEAVGLHLNQDLERQTFPDDTFDLVITQDVFEHLFRPDRAIRDIVRTLKPGGAHIMSVPIVRKNQPSRRRASFNDGKPIHHLPAEYHGNPVDPQGSLVTIDWGYDIAEYLAAHGGPTTIVSIDDPAMGIRAEYIEIVVTRKQAAPIL